MEDNKRKKSVKNRLSVKRMALVTLSAGCLTFLVAGLALAGGLLLDARLGTFPRWTLILLIGSAPITLGGVYWIVRRTLRRMKAEGSPEEEPLNEGEND